MLNSHNRYFYRIFFINLASLIVLCGGYSHSAIIDETWGSTSRANMRSFESSRDLKSTKKVGVGISTLGANGLLGLNIAINLASDFALNMGYGASRGFNSINLNVRQSFGGDEFIPYFTAGYSRWFSNQKNEPVKETTPGFFRDKFLTAREKETGRFAENIIYPGFGLEFLNKSGDWQGFAVNAELLYLLNLEGLVSAPIIGIGSTLYF